MATRSNIGILREDGTIEAIYSHYDGYPSGVGKTLRDHYTDIDKIEELINLGNVSSLEKNITKPEGHSFSNRIDGFTTFYGRDRGDKEQEARIYDKLIQLQANDYTYIWDDEKGKWFFTDNYEDKSKRIDLATADLDKFAKGGMTGPLKLAITPNEFSPKVEEILDEYGVEYRLDPDYEQLHRMGEGKMYIIDDYEEEDLEDAKKDLSMKREGVFTFYKGDDPADGDMDVSFYKKGGKINEFVFYQVEENEAGDGETYDNLDEAEMHWERLTDEQREEGTLMKMYWECEDGVCDITDTEIIYGKGGTLHKSIKHHYGLGGYLASGAIGAYLGAKNPTKVRKVTDPLDKAFSDIGKNFSDKKYAEGGDVEGKEYVLERYYVYVHKDDYEEGETDNVHNWDSSDYGDNDKTFSSKSALMDFIKEVIDRDTQEDNTRDDYFMIESDDDETTIDYSVLCKYNAVGRGYDNYEKASDEEIEQWKKGDLELFSVGFTFKVKVYETRKRAEFKEGGSIKDNKNAMITGGILGVLLGVFLNR